MRETNSVKNSGLSAMIKPMLLGLTIGTVITFAVMLLCSALILFGNLSSVAAVPISTVCAGFGAFFSAFIAAKSHGRQGFIIGAVTALVLFVIIMLISFAVSDGGFTIVTLLRLMVMLLAGMVGGSFAMRNSRRRKNYI